MERKVLVKVHHSGKTEILAICDKNLLGKTLVSGEIKMKLNPPFYEGREVLIEDALKLMLKYGNVNAVGSVIELGIEKKLINKHAVLWLNTEEGLSVPHLLIFRMPPV